MTMRAKTEKPASFIVLIFVLLALVVGTPAKAAAENWKPPPDTHVEVGVEGGATSDGSRNARGCPDSPYRDPVTGEGLCDNGMNMSWNSGRGCWAIKVTANGNGYTTDNPTISMPDPKWEIYHPDEPGYYGPGGPGWNAAGGEGQTSGSLYFCYNRDCHMGSSHACNSVDTYWAAGPTVSPRTLAERAVAAMDLRAPAVGMTGGDPPDHMMIVGVPAWMWAADPGESTTGPVTRSAADGGISVTATGVLDKTVWDMGDGVKVTCSGAKAAGTPFEQRYGGQPSPTCGYTYQRTSAGKPDNAFTVTVTAHWTVTWSGGGESGVITRQVSRSIPKKVGEIQALLVPVPGGRS